MMKKLLSLVLALTLASGLALPAAAAEESADAALARVTQAVKDTLALDTTGYDQFQGDRYAALAQGLGMVGESYSGVRTATRGELAAMLCRLLER